MFGAAIAAIAIAAPTPSSQPNAAVSDAVDVAISTCEQWILNPATWADGFDQFPQKSGMAARGLVIEPTVPEIALPPREARRGLHYWRVPIGEGGIYVTASDQLPVCHMAGGGLFDVQPGVAGLQASAAFLKRWKVGQSQTQRDMVSTTYISLHDPKFSLILSRAANAGDRTDRVQIIATAQYDIGK